MSTRTQRRQWPQDRRPPQERRPVDPALYWTARRGESSDGVAGATRWGGKWGWLRSGILLALLGVGAFWLVRLAIWAIAYWMRG